eukprot:Opistho-1_new@64219
MFLHSRGTGGDFNRVVREHRHKFSTGVVHSFDGTKEEAADIVAMGLYIGINGCSLKTADNLAVLATIPSERLMIETDAPWCDIRATHAGNCHVRTRLPDKKKERFEMGTAVKGRNEPANIRQVLEVMAGARKEDSEALAEAMYANTLRVFFPLSGR